MPEFAVTLVHGPAWDAARGIRDQDGWDAHAEFMDALVASGFILVGGPVGDGPAERRDRTLHLVHAADEAAVRGRFADDPWSQAGLLEVDTIRPWALWLDSRSSSRR